jgi:hypothetical protein
LFSTKMLASTVKFSRYGRDPYRIRAKLRVLVRVR